jgi:hypothetical protein
MPEPEVTAAGAARVIVLPGWMKFFMRMILSKKEAARRPP